MSAIKVSEKTVYTTSDGIVHYSYDDALRHERLKNLKLIFAPYSCHTSPFPSDQNTIESVLLKWDQLADLFSKELANEP